jgi:hypothetical protein
MATTRQKSGLTRKGSAVKGQFSKRYGKRGASVFFATMNAHPKMKTKLVKKSARKK